MANIYHVNLSEEERASLLHLIRSGERSARKLNRARILLLADEGKMDQEIAAALHSSVPTVQRTRERFGKGGLDNALTERPRLGGRKAKKLDEKGEAILVTLARSEPPAGRKRWTLQLLADRLVELRVVESISDETVRQVCKKRIKPWVRKRWCIPTVGAEFVWRMEDVLALYARAHNPRRPLICFDEKMVQLIAETRCPLPMEPGKPTRYDYEYKRNGTANLFVFFMPPVGWRHVRVTERRTKIDFAESMRYLVDELLPEAEVIVVVSDNLNTHTPAALYEAFPPAEAKRILGRLELHHTPKHGSWLNMVKIEIGVLWEQCLDRCIPDLDTLRAEVEAWEAQRNEQETTVNWQFTISDARIKLDRLYPDISQSQW